MLTTTVCAIESYDKADLPKLAALYDEDVLEVSCVACGQAEQCDYGVAGSPAWTEITDIYIDSYEINGVEYSRKQVRIEHGVDVEFLLNEICAEAAAEKEDWE